ncbi:hypothetical protein [Streptomyces sp. NPDC049881]|uniref:hypothetical protein n=1 Tax=Streptomyces sp. NPDC049881 TaxID=3155778 RepID=UPI00341E0FC8
MPASSLIPRPRSTVLRRALVGGALLLVLVALAGLVAHLTRGSQAPADEVAEPSDAVDRELSPEPSPSHGVQRVLPTPVSTDDPAAFAEAAAVALWSYDTRRSSQPEALDALRAWMTRETEYADWPSVEHQLPDPLLWLRMADQDQFATAEAAEAHFPESFTRALQEDPGAITEAYVYAVTVTGQQSIAWKGSPDGGTEARAITLAVQCRPDQDCTLVGVLPNVAP